MKEKQIVLVSSVDINGGIGFSNDLLFDIPYDKRYFKSLTTKTQDPEKINAVVMGYNTWKSIPDKYKPLRDRLNVVCTRRHKDELDDDDVLVCDDLDNLLKLLNTTEFPIENIFIIGGSSLYHHFIDIADKIVLCNIYESATSVDTHFPNFDKNNYEISDKTSLIHTKARNVLLKTNQEVTISYTTWSKKIPEVNTEEKQYLDLLAKILMEGTVRNTRSGKVRSIFGVQMKYSLRNNTLPLLTTKKMFTRGIIEELLWFVNSRVDSKILEEKRVNIWKGNTSREFLDSLNAPYKGPDADYTDTGVDQLAQCIDLIKNNPTSRRILMSGWNPCQMSKMCLPPCHVLYQFYVDDGHLHCSMYQRSGDMFLGIPFNIASTSILTTMLAHITDLKPGSITHTIGDAHIYETHLTQACTQISRKPYKFPKICIQESDMKIENIEDFKLENFKISDYTHHSRISAKMSV